MRSNNKNNLSVAVVGATGMVGLELLSLLEKRRFPVRHLLPFSSGKSRRFVRFKGKPLPAPAIDKTALFKCDLVFMVSSEEVARRYAPALAQAGIWVIDDSSEFRLAPNVPLVIPEVNSDALSRTRRLIAGPNCTMTGIAVAGYPWHRKIGIRAVRISSYQAVSGAGKSALCEFFRQSLGLNERIKKFSSLRAPIWPSSKSSILPRSIAGNIFPQVGGFDDSGYSEEERKVASELRKIWSAPSLPVSVTAVRVPVIRGHALSVWITLASSLSSKCAGNLIRTAPGIKLYNAPNYPTPLDMAGTWPVGVGRLRQGLSPRELCLWVVSDNLLKGAALNSIQIAETLQNRGWLNPS